MGIFRIVVPHYSYWCLGKKDTAVSDRHIATAVIEHSAVIVDDMKTEGKSTSAVQVFGTVNCEGCSSGDIGGVIRQLPRPQGAGLATRRQCCLSR